MVNHSRRLTGPILASVLCIPALFTSSWSQEKAAQDEEQLLDEYVVFSEVGLKVRQPKGYEKQKVFVGFGNEETQCSILCTKLPAPYAEVSKGFDKANLEARGWKMLSRAEIKVDDKPAVLINFEQPAGGSIFEKWSLILGDEKQTLLVTATYPQRIKKSVEPALKAAILSTRRDQSGTVKPSDALPFTVEASKKLVANESFSRMLMYNLDGKIPGKSPKDPLLIIAPSIGDVRRIADRKAFAERQLRSTSNTKDLEIQETKKIEIDGLETFESRATAKDTKTGEPLQVYQAILFDKESYVRVIGLVGEEHAKEFLPEFETMAKSIKRRQSKD